VPAPALTARSRAKNGLAGVDSNSSSVRFKLFDVRWTRHCSAMEVSMVLARSIYAGVGVRVPLSSLASTWQMRSGRSCGCGHSNSCLNARPIARTAARLATISSLVGADMDVSGQSERLLTVVGHKSVNVELTFRLDRAVRLASASRPQLGGDPTHHARSEKDANAARQSG